MRVLKFGGTSLANRARITDASRLVPAAAEESRVVVVASAMAGVTNVLEKLIGKAAEAVTDWTPEVDSLECRHLKALAGLPNAARRPAEAVVRSRIRNLRADLDALADIPRDRLEIRDRILAAGERLAVELLAASLQGQGCAARAVDGAGLVATDSTFGEANVDFARTGDCCRQLLEAGNAAIPVVTGFIGADRDGRTTTLGRGGSDFTAAVLGSVLDAERVEIWTDVDGVLTAPPRLVPGASSIPRLSYEEAAEMSFFGAKVLHPQTVRPLAERGIPIFVRNTLAPSRRGTEIGARSESTSRVVAVSAFEDVTVLRVRSSGLGFLEEALMSCRASCDGASLVAVPTHRAEALIARLEQHEGLPLEHHFPASIVTLVGHEIALQPWVAGRALESLGRRGITVRSFAAGAGPHTMTLVVERNDLEASLCTIHDALELDREMTRVGRRNLGLKKREVERVAAA